MRAYPFYEEGCVGRSGIYQSVNTYSGETGKKEGTNYKIIYSL